MKPSAYGNSREALHKALSLSLDSGRIRLWEALCGAGVAFFRGSPEKHFAENSPPGDGQEI
jgi:hypothetical protein